MIKPAGGTWQAQTITTSGNMKHFSIWAYPAYMGTEEILFGSSSGRIFSRKHEIGTNALAAQTTIQLPSNTQDVIGFWCHDLNRGLAFTRAPAKIFTLTSTDPAHVSPPLSAALLAAPAQWPDLLNTQTDPALYAVNTIAFSDRAHGFIGGTYNNAGMTSNAGIARRVTDETGLYSNRMWYDPLGRVVLSQNSWQFGLSPKRYSYTRYDRLGRPYEAGEIGDQNNTFQSIFGEEVGGAFMPSVVDTTDLAAFLNNSANPKREVLRTFYDHAIPSNTFPIQQDHLRLRVASTTFQETYNSDPLVFDHATHYSYDIHGNVKQLVQDQPLMAADAQASVQRWKKLDYTYDLISGNVTEAAYQKGQLDQLTHRYSYDADNRITEVETSPNDMDWTRQARYFYYPHGPLQRTELGQQPVQGIDYAYTLQGWIRAVNSDLLRPEHDMGHDALAGDLNALTGRDAMGYSLQYHSGDYEAIDASAWASGARPMAVPGGNYQAATHDLFNGNIAAWTQSLQPFTGWTNTATDERGQVLGMAYRYDQLNRLKRANGFQDPGTDNDWTTAATTHANLYHSNYAYDANGNITKANRYDQSGSRYDSLYYYYHDVSSARMQNRLYQLKDLSPDTAVTSADGVEDLPYQNTSITNQDKPGNTGNTVNSPAANNPAPNNFLYDALGRLKCDTKEEIAAITWTVASKVKQVDRTGSSSRKKLIFGYGAGGQRITKAVLNNGSTTINTRDHYVHDAQGHIMAIYRYNGHNGTFTLMERPMYGSDRVGTDAQGRELMLQTQLDQSVLGTAVPPATPAELRYELKDHLGNVAAAVSGEVYPVDANNDQVAEFLQPHLLSASGYEPFGALLPGRNYSLSSYRFGFNGKENDNEVYGSSGAPASGTFQDYGMRAYDTRVGRFFSVDPIGAKYPMLTPYQFASNSPIAGVDLDGLEFFYAANGAFLDKMGTSTDVYVVKDTDVEDARLALNLANMGWLDKGLAQAGTTDIFNLSQPLGVTNEQLLAFGSVIDAESSGDKAESYAIGNVTMNFVKQGGSTSLPTLDDVTMYKNSFARGATQSAFTAFKAKSAKEQNAKYGLGAAINALGWAKGLQGYGFSDETNGADGWDGIDLVDTDWPNPHRGYTWSKDSEALVTQYKKERNGGVDLGKWTFSDTGAQIKAKAIVGKTLYTDLLTGRGESKSNKTKFK